MHFEGRLRLYLVSTCDQITQDACYQLYTGSKFPRSYQQHVSLHQL